MTVLVAENEEDLKYNITALQEAVREQKLGINQGKTNSLVISREPIEVEEHSVKSMKEVMHLGVTFSMDGRMERELDRGLGITMSATGAMQRIVFGSRELRKKVKVEVYNAMVANDDVCMVINLGR